MSVRERILHRLTRSDFVRAAYTQSLRVPVVNRLFRKFAHSVVPQSRLWICIPGGLAKGFWMYADPRSELGYTNGDHEPWLQNLLQSELRPGDCYYDVGAHSGFFCLIAARILGPSGTVVAVEPDPANISLLRANIERNRLTQASVVQAAIWSETGEVAFQAEPDASNGTKGRVLRGAAPSTARSLVPAVRLDDLVFQQGKPAPDLIKMDVEGAEWEALHSASRVLSEVKPKVFCEVHDPAQMDPIRLYLEGFGYTVRDWKPVHEHYADYRQTYLWATVPGADVRLKN